MKFDKDYERYLQDRQDDLLTDGNPNWTWKIGIDGFVFLYQDGEECYMIHSDGIEADLDDWHDVLFELQERHEVNGY